MVDVEDDDGRFLKGHVITTRPSRRRFCEVEKSDGNRDNIVQISIKARNDGI